MGQKEQHFYGTGTSVFCFASLITSDVTRRRTNLSACCAQAQRPRLLSMCATRTMWVATWQARSSTCLRSSQRTRDCVSPCLAHTTPSFPCSCADSAFDIAAVRKAAEGKTVVVFHCMESVMRGPRCARRLLDSSQGETLPFAVRVLRGGADRWIRRFYRDPTLVSNFDKDYWGFLTHGEATESVHKEYSRPDNFHLDM